MITFRWNTSVRGVTSAQFKVTDAQAPFGTLMAGVMVGAPIPPAAQVFEIDFSAFLPATAPTTRHAYHVQMIPMQGRKELSPPPSVEISYVPGKPLQFQPEFDIDQFEKNLTFQLTAGAAVGYSYAIYKGLDLQRSGAGGLAVAPSQRASRLNPSAESLGRSIMVRYVASLVLAVLVLVLLPPAASPAAAQTPRQILITPAFTILKWDDTGFGFNVDVGVPLKAKTAMTFDVVGDFSFLRFGEDQETDLFFSGAPRVRFTKNASATPFVQMQVGVNRWMDEGTSGSNFFIGPGGGVIFPIGNYHFKLQIDFPIVMFDEGSDTTTRFSFGIEFPRRK